jgi:hypothetical protein
MSVFCHVTVGGVVSAAIAEPVRTATTLIAAISAHVNLNLNKTYLLKVEPLDLMPLRQVLTRRRSVRFSQSEVRLYLDPLLRRPLVRRPANLAPR